MVAKLSFGRLEVLENGTVVTTPTLPPKTDIVIEIALLGIFFFILDMFDWMDLVFFGAAFILIYGGLFLTGARYHFNAKGIVHDPFIGKRSMYAWGDFEGFRRGRSYLRGSLRGHLDFKGRSLTLSHLSNEAFERLWNAVEYQLYALDRVPVLPQQYERDVYKLEGVEMRLDVRVLGRGFVEVDRLEISGHVVSSDMTEVIFKTDAGQQRLPVNLRGVQIKEGLGTVMNGIVCSPSFFSDIC